MIPQFICDPNWCTSDSCSVFTYFEASASLRVSLRVRWYSEGAVLEVEALATVLHLDEFTAVDLFGFAVGIFI